MTTMLPVDTALIGKTQLLRNDFALNLTKPGSLFNIRPYYHSFTWPVCHVTSVGTCGC